MSSAGNYFGHSTVLLNGVLWLYGGLGDGRCPSTGFKVLAASLGRVLCSGDYSGYSNRLYSIDLQALVETAYCTSPPL